MSIQSRRGAEWNKKRAVVIERDNGVCQYGMEGCTYDQDITVDHITSVDAGGEDTDDNLITACRTCNGRKSNRSLLRINYTDNDWLRG